MDADRAGRIEAVIAQVLEDRARGKVLDEADVVAAHPHLMPELGTELAALRSIHRTFLASLKAGPATESASYSVEGSSEALQSVDADSAPSTSPPVPPLVIQGYAILQEVRSGGQATVFKAVQESTGRVVAIKVIAGGPLTSSRHRVRFEREASILACLTHPGIVGILDRGRTADGSMFLVMDFIDGHPLDESLAQGSLDAMRRVRLFVEIARAMEEAHQHGFVHRDLKPSNVLIDQWGRPHILDFGLARLLNFSTGGSLQACSMTHAGQIVGSLPWSSPEQISDADRVDARSDVYSLGVMLYQAMTGEFPYSVTGPIREVMGNILETTPPPPGQRPQGRALGLEPALDAIVLKSLAKSPDHRYATAGELAKDLEAFLSGQPVQAMALQTSSRKGSWRQAAVAGLVVLGVLSAAGWHRFHRAFSVHAVELPAVVNSLGMRLVRLPPGSFAMGSPAQEQGRGNDESRHIVNLRQGFYLATTEVTQRQYQLLMGKLPCEQPAAGPDLPVQGVRWAEAVEFCRKLSEKEGRRYRLPAEAEWEYACRAGTATPFAGTGNLNEMGWFAENSGNRLHPVAGKSPNHWGLYDMHGGVQEWCADIYRHVYSNGGRVESQATDGINHVVRGGGIHQPKEACRSAARSVSSPANRSDHIGFRVALDVEPTSP